MTFSGILARIISLSMISIFMQNAIFDRAFGANVAIYTSRKEPLVAGFTFGITAMTTTASIVTYFIDKPMLALEHGYYFMPLIYIGVIGILYIAGLFFLWKFFHKTFKKVRKYAHLAIFNCAVIGALFLNSNYGSDLPAYIGYGFGSGVGFFLACFLLNIAQEQLNSEKIPRVFRGYPIMMIYIGIMSLALNVLIGYTAEF
ncbi:MAG: hypothetical protein K2J80_10540 [Oscillospiraceae bacterium]|nr:hypothetical protein [Oscillospiraceae bacterium]